MLLRSLRKYLISHIKRPLQRKMLSRSTFPIFAVFLGSVYLTLLFLIGGKSKEVNVLIRNVSNKPLFREVRIQHYPTAKVSKTKPPFYPLNGTGKTVNISGDFETKRFEDFCEMEMDLVAIVPVYSAPENFERRKAMRNTVGKVCAKLHCKLFFIVGVSLNKTIYDKLKEEYLTANDILIFNKVDSYRDLNDKVVAMLEWLIDFCRRPKYVIHIIDDCYPNLKLILEQLRSIKKSNFILGHIYNGALPIREPSKVQLTDDEYPYAKFPPYAVGVVYAFLNDDSVILRRTLHAVEYCWVEDVWFAGHVREGAGFELVQLHRPYSEQAVSANSIKWIWNRHSGIHFVNSNSFYVIYNHTRV